MPRNLTSPLRFYSGNGHCGCFRPFYLSILCTYLQFLHDNACIHNCFNKITDEINPKTPTWNWDNFPDHSIGLGSQLIALIKSHAARMAFMTSSRLSFVRINPWSVCLFSLLKDKSKLKSRERLQRCTVVAPGTTGSHKDFLIIPSSIAHSCNKAD